MNVEALLAETYGLIESMCPGMMDMMWSWTEEWPMTRREYHALRQARRQRRDAAMRQGKHGLKRPKR